MSRLEFLTKELKQHDENLKEIEEMLAAVPDYQEALDMKAEILEKRQPIEEEIATLSYVEKSNVKSHASPVPTPASPSVEKKEKWSKENHPAFRKTLSATPVAVEEPKSFSIGDTVTAKYAGDKSFYPAQIISVTGSSSAPIYTVKFRGYNDTETVRSHEIRAIQTPAVSGQKRKADGSPSVAASSTPVISTAPVTSGNVISAAANINPALASAIKKEPSKISDGPARPDKIPKKVKTNKALESSKQSWQSWQSKATTGKAAKVVQKESMFRTGDAHTARVGFTGSGQTMRKDGARTRHNYQLNDE